MSDQSMEERTMGLGRSVGETSYVPSRVSVSPHALISWKPRALQAEQRLGEALKLLEQIAGLSAMWGGPDAPRAARRFLASLKAADEEKRTYTDEEKRTYTRTVGTGSFDAAEEWRDRNYSGEASK